MQWPFGFQRKDTGVTSFFSKTGKFNISRTFTLCFVKRLRKQINAIL